MKKFAILTAFAISALSAAPAAAAPVWNLDVHHAETNFAPGGGAAKIGPVVTVTEGVAPETDEVQHIGAIIASAGTYKLSFDGETTANLAFDANSSTVEAALEALPAIGGGNVSVTGSMSYAFSGGKPHLDLTFMGALAATDVPQVTVSNGTPRPGIHPELWFDVNNVGDTATSGLTTLTVTLPKGLTFAFFQNHNLSQQGANVKWSCPAAPGATKVVCTTNGQIARHAMSEDVRLAINVAEDAVDPRVVGAKLEGGGAANVATVTERISVSSEPSDFGVLPDSFRPGFFASDEATPVTQSGDHPDLFTVPFDFNTNPEPTPEVALEKRSAGNVRDLQVDLPPGFLGNPTAVGECSQAKFTLTVCPYSSQIGRIDLRLDGLSIFAGPETTWLELHLGLFNLSHPRGALTDLGLAVGANPVHILASLDAANNYAITTSVSNINETLPPMTQKLTVWGVPADSSHDSERCPGFSLPEVSTETGDTSQECSTDHERKPFLTVPFQCGVDNVFRLHHYDSWAETGVYGPPIEYTSPEQTTGCDKPRFEPDVEIVPTGKQANTPTGLDLHVKVPQNESADGLATPPAKQVKVTLPEGMSFSPSFADGLQSCTLAQVKLGTNDPVACPDASRIGEVELHTPLLPNPAEGSMYIAAQGDNPFGSLFALYLVLADTEERGALLKIPGRIEVDPKTGQITTVFDALPQFPFDDMTLKFRSGPRAPLINSPTCGTHTIGVQMSSYAQPDNLVDVSNTYQVTEGPNGSACQSDAAKRPFVPAFNGGTLNPVAGSFSTFLFRLTRQDSEQELSRVTTILPKGLLAKIAGIPFCSDALIASIPSALGTGTGERANPACPAASRIGTVSAGLGAGPGPNYFPGNVYLAGPYKNAPLSLAIVVPALAGPFDLGSTVVRVALEVDPETSRVTAVSDPFPTILHGVILRVRDVRLRLDRPETTLNPTSCDPNSLDAQVFGVGGSLLDPADDSLFLTSDYFQVGNCERLGFKPRLSLRLRGGTHRSDHPALIARLVARPGDANIGSSIVALPRSEFLENAHIRTICTRVQFRADECPAGSIYGSARAVTPLLDQPITGDVVLRSSDHPLPDLVARLRGQISANLVGRIDSVNGGIRTSFETVPDVPVTEFTLKMQGGKKGLLVNSRNLCLKPSRADVKFTAQNGKRIRMRPVMRNGCKGQSRVKSRRHNRKRG